MTEEQFQTILKRLANDHSRILDLHHNYLKKLSNDVDCRLFAIQHDLLRKFDSLLPKIFEDARDSAFAKDSPYLPFGMTPRENENEND